MAGFNGSKKVPLTEDKRTTLNHEGERVHKLDSLETLFSRVLGSFFGESTFYERRNAEEEFKKLVHTINSVDYEDIEYVLKIKRPIRFLLQVSFALNNGRKPLMSLYQPHDVNISYTTHCFNL